MLFLWLFLVYVNAKPLVAAFLSEQDRLSCRIGWQPLNNNTLTCDYHPIVLDRDSLEYETYFGERQLLAVVAWASDEHASSLLVIAYKGDLKSKSLYPYITVSHSNDPYGPEYSNALWERVVAASSLIIDRDQTSKTQK